MPHRDLAQRRAYHRQWMAERRRALRAQGVCERCWKGRAVRYGLCWACLEMHRAQVRAFIMQKRRARGMQPHVLRVFSLRELNRLSGAIQELLNQRLRTRSSDRRRRITVTLSSLRRTMRVQAGRSADAEGTRKNR